MRRRDDELGIAHLEPCDDVFAHARRRRGGQREHLRFAEPLPLSPEPQVRGPEIVAPLRNAVRLVDGEERGMRVRDALADLGGLERLGRRQHDERSAGGEPLERGAALGGAQAAVEANHRQAPPLERALLIGHQRDQRRHDDRRPIERQRHRLIEQRLAVAGRQHGQRIAPVEERAKRTLLLRPQPRDAELLSGDRARPRERIGAALATAAPPSLPRTASSLPRAFVRGHQRIPAEVDVTTASSTGGASSSNTLRLSRIADYSKLNMSSSSGRSMPCSWYFSQKCAHGRPYMSGTSYSMIWPGETGVARPLIG